MPLFSTVTVSELVQHNYKLLQGLAVRLSDVTLADGHSKMSLTSLYIRIHFALCISNFFLSFSLSLFSRFFFIFLQDSRYSRLVSGAIVADSTSEDLSSPSLSVLLTSPDSSN